MAREPREPREGDTTQMLLVTKTEVNERLVREQNKMLEEKVEERTHELKEAKEQSDKLLLNILPEETAHELKLNGKARPRTYGMVTVIFTDFKGFTSMSEQLSPELLVEEIDHCFSAFDSIMEKHTIEKIKTVGDAYIAAAGLPTPNFTHAVDAVKAAIEMCDFIELRKKQKIGERRTAF